MNKLFIFIAFIVLYFLIEPIIKIFLTEGKKTKKKKISSFEDLDFFQKNKRYRQFAFKEYSNKKLAVVLYFSFALIPAILSLFNIFIGIVVLFIIPFVSNLFLYNLIKKELDERISLLQRILKFKKSKMGLIDTKSSILNYENEFIFLEYDEEGRPSKIKITISPNFDPTRANDFIEEFSIQFGGNKIFEVDNSDPNSPGWNVDKGYAIIKLQKALPNKAMWNEIYIKHPYIQWSFFPLGIASKGGVPIEDPETGETIHVIGYDVFESQSNFMNKNGLPVSSDLVSSPHSIGAGVTGGGKSVSQRNIINGCLMRPDKWLLFGIDMKKVELGKLRRFGVPVATTYKDAAEIATFVQKIMIERFEELERREIENWDKMPEEDKGPAIMLMIDEASELLEPFKGTGDEANEIKECQEIIRSALSSIARLGRAAFVFQTIWTQRPEANVVPMQIRQNCTTKIGSGSLPDTISQMLFNSRRGVRVPAYPKGRMLIKTHDTIPIEFQGFFADPDWFKNWRERQGLSLDVYSQNETKNQFEEKRLTEEPEDNEMTLAEFDEILENI